MKLLVIGATGTIGTHIIKALAQPKTVFNRLAIFTSPETRDKKVAFLNELRFQGVEILVGDLGNDDQVKSVFEGFEVIVSALGRNALHLQPHLADLIASLPKLPSGKPRRFFPSEYGTDIKYDAKTSPHEKPHQNKLKTRAHIEFLAKEGKLEFTYIVTGPFIDTFIFARAGGKACYDREASTFGIIGSENDESVISGTTYRDTGRYVLSSVNSLEASRNATIRVSSIDAKPSEMLAALKKVEGSEKNIQARYTSLEDFKKLEQEAWEKTPEKATVYTLTRIWFEGGSDFTKKPKAVYLDEKSGKEVENQELAEQLFKDIQKESLEDVLRPLLA